MTDTLKQPSPLKDVETRASGGAYEEPLEYGVGMTREEIPDSVHKGMEESLRGEAIDRGSFAKYVE